MKPPTLWSALLLALSVSAIQAADADPTRALPEGEKPHDARIGKVRTLDDKDFDFHVPTTLKEWETRRQALREQVLVAEGLWPMPEKTPLNPVIHGKIDRDDYTVEKVFFASMPGHYVSGNLYRPKGKTGKLPAVLSPHGHWKDGRMYDAGETVAKKTDRDKCRNQHGRRPLSASGSLRPAGGSLPIVRGDGHALPEPKSAKLVRPRDAA